MKLLKLSCDDEYRYVSVMDFVDGTGIHVHGYKELSEFPAVYGLDTDITGGPFMIFNVGENAVKVHVATVYDNTYTYIKVVIGFATGKKVDILTQEDEYMTTIIDGLSYYANMSGLGDYTYVR